MRKVQEYLQKITSAHATRQRYIAWLRAVLEVMVQAGVLFDDISKVYAIDDADGVCLDAIGACVGANRAVGGLLLKDDEYRNYIRSKVLQNSWDGTNGSMPGAWQAVFPDLQLSFKDNQNMTMDVTVVGRISQQLMTLILAGKIVPKPMGVSQTFTIINNDIETANVGVGTGLYEFGNDDLPNQG